MIEVKDVSPPVGRKGQYQAEALLVFKDQMADKVHDYEVQVTWMGNEGTGTSIYLGCFEAEGNLGVGV